ncbi:MAG: hypothetical protein ABI868_14130 [Acidobacteriota bacterium]
MSVSSTEPATTVRPAGITSPRIRETLAAAGAFTLLTLVLTWPLARSLASQLPADLGDPLLNTWILAWDAEHLLRAATGQLGALGEYWHANIFYPQPIALAYSEHLTAQAVMILPVYALTRNPILVYNVVFVATFVLSALGMFLLVRELTGSRSAALLAGVAYGFAPYRFGNLSHLQVLSSMWMPFAWLGFHRYFETRRLAPLAGGTLAWTAQNLSCGYYLLFFAPVMGIFLAWEMTSRRLWADRQVWRHLLAAAAAVTIATVPFLLPYLELRRLGFSARSLGETGRFSPDVYGYLTADVRMAIWGRLVRAWPKPEGSLFPGFTILLLAGLAVADRWWRGRRASHRWPSSPAARLIAAALIVSCGVLAALLLGWTLRAAGAGLSIKITSLSRVVILGAGLAIALAVVSPRARNTAAHWFSSPVGLFALVTIFSFVMSLGPEIYARGRLVEEDNVYGLFYAYVPGFDGLRVPARFAMIVALGLAGLGGYGAAVLARGRGAAVVAALTALIVAESWSVPLPLNENSTDYKQSGLAPLSDTLAMGSAAPAVYRLVAQLPASSALIEMPFGEIAFETRYMFYSTMHWRPLVNGYSGGAPDQYGLWAERLKDALDSPEPAWRAVAESRATHLIVHEAGYAGDRGQQISAWVRAHGGRELARSGTDRLFQIR